MAPKKVNEESMEDVARRVTTEVWQGQAMRQSLANLIKEAVAAELRDIIERNSAIIEKLQAALCERDERINKLETQLIKKTDDLEQYQRRQCLRIFGLKEEEGEDTDVQCIEVAKKIRVNLDVSDIDRCHRIGRKEADLRTMADCVISCYQNVIFSFFIFFTFIAFSEGVEINSIGLTTGLPFARNGTSAHFTYNVTLESNEVIESITWTKDEESGSYEWTKTGAKGLGVFSVANDTSVNAGEFIFNSVNFTETGNYAMIITTNIGTDFATFSFVVYDYSGFSLKSNSPGLGLNPKTKCIWRITGTVHRITPYPNISCIFEGGLNGSAQLPVAAIANMEQTITNLGDGFFSYNMTANVTMEKIPVESFLDCSNWIQNSKIQIMHIRDSAVSGQPCPEPPSEKNYTHEMVSGRDSCYGGYLPYTKFNYSCIEAHGIIPIHKKMLHCEGGEWIEKDDDPWPVCNQSSNQLRLVAMSSANTLQIKDLLLSAILYILCYSSST